MAGVFSCYVCQNPDTPCSKQTFRKENYPNCEAARKSLGFPVFATAAECQNYCTTGTKPININKVCWVCQGNGTCDHFLAFDGECPKGRNIFERREDCIANCTPIMPLNPPIQPIGPVPVVPLNPPIDPINPPLRPFDPPIDPIYPYIPVLPPVIDPVYPYIHPLGPQIQPIGPIPAIPIEAIKDDKWLYIIIAIVVFVLMTLLVGGLLIFL